jgi:hypothetical protein
MVSRRAAISSVSNCIQGMPSTQTTATPFSSCNEARWFIREPTVRKSPPKSIAIVSPTLISLDQPTHREMDSHAKITPLTICLLDTEIATIRVSVPKVCKQLISIMNHPMPHTVTYCHSASRIFVAHFKQPQPRLRSPNCHPTHDSMSRHQMYEPQKRHIGYSRFTRASVRGAGERSRRGAGALRPGRAVA